MDEEPSNRLADILFALGAVSATAGAALIYIPAGFLVFGAFLVVAAVGAAR